MSYLTFLMKLLDAFLLGVHMLGVCIYLCVCVCMYLCFFLLLPLLYNCYRVLGNGFCNLKTTSIVSFNESDLVCYLM